MKTTELIKKLEELVKDNGDLNIRFFDYEYNRFEDIKEIEVCKDENKENELIFGIMS